MNAYDPSKRNMIFVMSCISLIATAMVFSVRGEIIGALGIHFDLTPSQVGWVIAWALWGFTISMLIGGMLCDVIGMKNVLVLAFLAHVAGTILTIFAPGYFALAVATLIIGLGNGFVEAGINPLVATIYPDKKTHMLNILHAWWPGGLIIGGLLAYTLTQLGYGWQIKMWLILIPVIIYGIMLISLKLPDTERVASGVSTGSMYKEALRPLFLLWLFCMFLTAATELGTVQWIGEIMSQTGIESGILILVWISTIMLVGRLCAGSIVHRLSPIGLLIGSAIVAAIGLYWMSIVETQVMAYVASFVFAVGVCYFWPTMLGVTSERFPKGGAFLLALMGAGGMFAAGASMPLLGNMVEAVGYRGALQNMVIFPIILTVVFAIVFLSDRKKGGYQIERLSADEVVEEGHSSEAPIR